MHSSGHDCSNDPIFTARLSLLSCSWWRRCRGHFMGQRSCRNLDYFQRSVTKTPSQALDNSLFFSSFFPRPLNLKSADHSRRQGEGADSSIATYGAIKTIAFVTQIPGHIAGTPSPRPPSLRCALPFISREEFTIFFPRRLASNGAYTRC